MTVSILNNLFFFLPSISQIEKTRDFRFRIKYPSEKRLNGSSALREFLITKNNRGRGDPGGPDDKNSARTDDQNLQKRTI